MAMEIKVNVKQISDSASQGTARGHHIVCDRPEAKGGGDQGPMGGEVLLMGLGGCFSSNLLAAIAAREADVSNVNLEITATLEEAPPHFSAVHVDVSGTYSDKALMEKLVTIAERGCIVANTLKNAVKLSFSVA